MSFQFINFSFFPLFYSTKQKIIISLLFFFSSNFSSTRCKKKKNIFSPLFFLSYFLSFLFSFASKKNLNSVRDVLALNEDKIRIESIQCTCLDCSPAEHSFFKRKKTQILSVILCTLNTYFNP